MAEHAQHHDIVGRHSADDQYLETPPGAGYEHTDASVGVLVRFGFWLIVSAVLVHVGLALMYVLMIRQSAEPQNTQQYPLAVVEPLKLPPAPTLQRSGSDDLFDFRTKEDAQLHSYGWVDKNAGTVHIPIEDAMRMTVERGLPAREVDASKAAPEGMMPSDSSSGRVLERRRQ